MIVNARRTGVSSSSIEFQPINGSILMSTSYTMLCSALCRAVLCLVLSLQLLQLLSHCATVLVTESADVCAAQPSCDRRRHS